MEKLQKQALRLVFTDYTSSYAELRQRADIPLLYINRIRNEMIHIVSQSPRATTKERVLSWNRQDCTRQVCDLCLLKVDLIVLS